MNYKSSSLLFSVIKQDLSSYDANNLIDEGTFYRDVKHVINQLGVSAYEKKPAIIKVDDFKGDLPNDFAYIESAFKCSIQGNTSEVWNPQLGCVVKEEATCEEIEQCNSCDICCDNDKVISKITVRTFVKGVPSTYNFVAPILLRIGNVAKDRSKCASNCPCLFTDSPYYISLDNHHIYTNFKDDFIYLNYFAFPLDENGLPMIPDSVEIEQAIEYYIKAKIFENLWINGDDPNVEKKFSMLQQKADQKFRAASYERKLPPFSDMAQDIRRNRRKMNIYQIQTGFR